MGVVVPSVAAELIMGWYCYLEDDIVISDSLFFSKLQWFYHVVNNARYLLQPNRYEIGVDPEFSKVYVDGPVWYNSAEFITGGNFCWYDFRLRGEEINGSRNFSS